MGMVKPKHKQGGMQGHARAYGETVVGTHTGAQGQVGTPEHAHLWVLEECVLVVDAAPTAVLLWVLMPCPGTSQPGFFPCLVDAQVGCVEEAALDDVREIPAQVLEGHPGHRESR